MREAILRALERSRADYTEIRVEREWRTEVAYRKENLENLEASSELGGIVRLSGGRRLGDRRLQLPGKS
jgi:predicted Zn-dependent protease